MEEMSIGFIVLSVIFVLVCLGVTGAILLQKKKSAGGLGSIAGMGNVSDTYWDKNKSRSMEGSLEKWTKIGGATLGVLAIILGLI